MSSLKSGDKSYIFFTSLILALLVSLFIYDTKSGSFGDSYSVDAPQAVLSSFFLYEVNPKETQMVVSIQEAVKYKEREEMSGIDAQRMGKDGIDKLVAKSAKREAEKLEFPFGVHLNMADGLMLNSNSALYDTKKEQLRSQGGFDLGFDGSRANGTELRYDVIEKKIYASDIKVIIEEKVWKK